MAQVFNRSTNVIAKVSIFGAVFFVAFAGWLLFKLDQSPLRTREGVTREQPVPFSHDHHVAAMGIDCLYCHTSVERSAVAGIPPTATCMSCHKQIWAQSPMLEPVRESLRTGEPIEWVRVHDLPDFVYFDHSQHVNKGVGCVSCHGRVDKMPLIRTDETLQMLWCLDCHRHPEPAIRPKSEITDMAWEPPVAKTGAASLQAQLIEQYSVAPRLSCSTCHR